jgi:putative lipoprotein
MRVQVMAMVAFLVSCQPGPVSPEFAYVKGTLTYRERMALPGDVVIEVQLQDVSLADAPATVLATQRITSPSQVPIAFTLAYRSAAIDERNRYAVQARIEQGGRLLFINDTHTPVLTYGGGDRVDMLLVRVQEPVSTKAGDGMELTGMFHYMADAAVFRDCDNGLSFPVAMEAAYIDLERAYLDQPHEAGAEQMVRLRGRYLERPSMEGDSNAVHLVVDRFKGLVMGACEASPRASLTNTWWRLAAIGGQPVTVADHQREPHMVLDGTTSRVRGNAGCNNFFGAYESVDQSIRFSAVGSTKMACPGDEDTEQALLDALALADRYQISGEVLQLFAGDQLLARFESVYH